MAGISALLQVASVLTLTHGEATGVIRNTATSAMRVTVELHYATDSAGHITLLREVQARLSPRAVTLAPFQSQTLRIRVTENVPHGTTLRLLTTFTPDEPPPDTLNVRGVAAHITIVTRIISRVEQP